MRIGETPYHSHERFRIAETSRQRRAICILGSASLLNLTSLESSEKHLQTQVLTKLRVPITVTIYNGKSGVKLHPCTPPLPPVSK